MFGVNNGFDIVIGNPPYVQIKQIPEEDKPYYIRASLKTPQRVIT
jgi:methylase of polypeptide subunit release factors